MTEDRHLDEKLADDRVAWSEWYEARRKQMDDLIQAAAVFWGAGSEQHNLVRDVGDAVFKGSPPPSILAEIARLSTGAGVSPGYNHRSTFDGRP